jgi:hypothetical protein
LAWNRVNRSDRFEALPTRECVMNRYP